MKPPITWVSPVSVQQTSAAVCAHQNKHSYHRLSSFDVYLPQLQWTAAYKREGGYDSDTMEAAKVFLFNFGFNTMLLDTFRFNLFTQMASVLVSHIMNVCCVITVCRL